MADEEKKEVEAECPKNPPELNGVEDLSLLVYLEMPNVLFNLTYRFLSMPKKEIYCCVSCILLAVNPYEWLTYLTTQDMIDIYKKAQDSGDLKKTPHPFAVASRAYVRMVTRKKPQSLLCCGISGAGKSECAKQLIRYLAKTSPNDMDTGGDPDFIVNQIVQASIILEAWGNAKTTLNNNSSRFGKFVKIMYKTGAIIGSYMETYLLEKSRVIMQGPQERNYHIFYFIFKGVPADFLASCELTKPEKHWYLKQGGCVDVPGLNDQECFEEAMESLKLFRFSKTDLDAVWELTAGILHLGDAGFKENDGGNAEVADMAACGRAAKLWGLKSDALKSRLETASMEVMGKVIIKNIAPSKYNDNRDAVSKALFENSFLFVVERINAELFHVGGDVAKIMFIGVLDIFGFENFVTNSLEQFCINFTNEKIQGFFNYNIIQSEQEEYIKESVLWKPMEVPDNSDFVAMIEMKKKGMFALLDSACKAPKPSAEQFYKEFFKNQGKMKQYLEKAKGPKSAGKKKKKKKKGKGKQGGPFLTIHHFCDDVIYDCSLYLDKNMDAIHPDSAKMFASSSKPIVQMIGGGTHQKKKKKKKKKQSVTGFFSKQLIRLVKTLEMTEPYFCRAMKPNWNKSAKEWDDVLVEDQLRSGGLIEALRVLKLGYPTRVPYQKIWDGFHGRIQNPLVNNLNKMGFAEVVLAAFGVNPAFYELGLTKIFFKPAKAAVLDTIMESAGKTLTPEQNAMIEKFVKMKRMKQLIGCAKVYLKLSFRVRARQAQSTINKIGRTFGYLGIAMSVHLDIANKQYEEAHAAELSALKAQAEAQDKEAAAADAAAAEEERLAKIEAEKADRAKAAERAEKLRLAQEKAQRDKENSELWKLLHPVDSDEEEYEDDDGVKHTRKKIDFKTESMHGHLFTIYNNNKSKAPHDRFVKVDWNGDKPTNISWGSGDRQMDWSLVKFVIKGAVTPATQMWSANIKEPANVFSIIATDGRTLDMMAEDMDTCTCWADGITKTLEQKEEDRAAMQESYTPLETKEDGPSVDRTASQEETRSKLVQMHCLTAFKDFERVGVYNPVCYADVVKGDFDEKWATDFVSKSTNHWRHWEWEVRQAIIQHCIKESILDEDIVDTAEEAKMAENKEYERFMHKQPPADPDGSTKLGDCNTN